MSAKHGAPESEFVAYEDGVLHFDGVSLADVASAHGTPTFVYSPRSIEAAYRAIDDALAFAPHLIAYAVKANGNLAVLRRLAAAGCGADIVSGGELARALRAGIPAERIVFSGVGKREDELRAAVEAGIKSIHAESVGEIRAIERVAKALGKKAHIALRVNPNVDAQTHPYIATGLHSTKFGIEPDHAAALLPELVANEHIDLIGVACHIGSQLGSPTPLREAVELLGQFAIQCRDAGAPIREIDVGGGWSMNYGNEETPYPAPSAYGAAIREGLAASGADRLGAQLVTEPGRSIVGDGGILLSRVLYIKDQGQTRFVRWRRCHERLDPAVPLPGVSRGSARRARGGTQSGPRPTSSGRSASPPTSSPRGAGSHRSTKGISWPSVAPGPTAARCRARTTAVPSPLRCSSRTATCTWCASARASTRSGRAKSNSSRLCSGRYALAGSAQSDARSSCILCCASCSLTSVMPAPLPSSSSADSPSPCASFAARTSSAMLRAISSFAWVTNATSFSPNSSMRASKASAILSAAASTALGASSRARSFTWASARPRNT